MADEGSVASVMEMMKENAVEYVDLRFTDPRGKWQHTGKIIIQINILVNEYLHFGKHHLPGTPE